MLKKSSKGRNPNRRVGRKTAALRSAASAGANGRALTESILTDPTAAAGGLRGGRDGSTRGGPARGMTGQPPSVRETLYRDPGAARARPR